jgi:hypothetical protein
MTDREFIIEIRHGLIIIMRACIKRYAMAWRDFLPADIAAAAFVAPSFDLTTAGPLDATRKTS